MKMLTHEIIFQFKSAMSQAGLNCPSTPIADGAIHRFKQDGDKDTPCWYVLHIINDKLAFSAFGCCKRDIKEKWCNRTINTLTAGEKTIYKQKQDQWQKELKEVQVKAKERACYIWERSSSDFTAHPYLENKQVKSFGLRLHKNMLLVPLYDENNELCSLQFITSTGDKRFKKDCRTKGCYFVIGKVTEIIYIAEGYATAATIHEITNCHTIVAFNANNLLPIAKKIRDKYSKHEIIICADNDAYFGGEQ
jgi:putative DNA primase/helicase